VVGVTGIRFACQTYSWQLTIDRYRGRIDHMVKAAAAAGFTGFEPELVMLGDDWSADQLSDTLAENGMVLAALCLVEPWRGPSETEAERRDADRVIEAVAANPGAIINLCQYPGDDRSELRERQGNVLSCLDTVSKRAAEAGVHCTFHPNSPVGSVFRTREDYEVLLGDLPPRIGFTPDLGHLSKGGMDPLEVVRTYRERVDHLHVKDIAADGTWAATGAGIIDIAGIVDYLVGSGYQGWITMEDESPEAERDPDHAVLGNGDYIRDVLSGVTP
jgi:inosose dehydratase